MRKNIFLITILLVKFSVQLNILKQILLLNLYMDNIITLEKIESVLCRIRPHLQVDGGDVEVVSIEDNSIVKVRLLGACNSCPLNLMTLRAGIERTLMMEFPEIIRIESVA